MIWWSVFTCDLITSFYLWFHNLFLLVIWKLVFACDLMRSFYLWSDFSCLWFDCLAQYELFCCMAWSIKNQIKSVCMNPVNVAINSWHTYVWISVIHLLPESWVFVVFMGSRSDSKTVWTTLLFCFMCERATPHPIPKSASSHHLSLLLDHTNTDRKTKHSILTALT